MPSDISLGIPQSAIESGAVSGCGGREDGEELLALTSPGRLLWRSMPPNKSDSKGHGNQRLKLVVRRLPPDLPPAVFWKTVSPWITREDAEDDGQEGAEKAVWSHYKQGKVRRR